MILPKHYLHLMNDHPEITKRLNNLLKVAFWVTDKLLTTINISLAMDLLRRVSFLRNLHHDCESLKS